MKIILGSVWCMVLVISSTAQPKTEEGPAPTVATRSSANDGQASNAPSPMTAAEFGQYLQTLQGQLTAWKQGIAAISFHSFDIDSQERGLLDDQRSLCLAAIEADTKDIESIQHLHSFLRRICCCPTSGIPRDI